MNETYSLLEFQGHVIDTPTYECKTKTMHFKAKAASLPPLKFKVKGQLAMAYKSMLHGGCLVQVTASPSQRLIEVNGELCSIVIWEAKRIAILGSRKVRLGNLADSRILDGLMPINGEVADVGYVDPISFGRFEERRARAKAKADALKAEEGQDD